VHLGQALGSVRAFGSSIRVSPCICAKDRQLGAADLQVPRGRVMGNLSVTVTGVSVRIHSGSFRRDIGRAFSAAS
jgi:hypothetical protein